MQTDPILIAIHGKPHSGKDTICNIILQKLPLMRYGPSVKVKETAATMFDVPIEYFYDEKMKEVIDPFWKISHREMAQKVGNESSRQVFGDDFWMQHVTKFLKTKLPKDKSGIILADIRYENEVQWTRQNRGIVLFVTRENRTKVTNELHPAEHGLSEDLADYIIRNNGSFQDLENSVLTFIENYLIPYYNIQS
jgi:dephospho-CoA kinase